MSSEVEEIQTSFTASVRREPDGAWLCQVSDDIDGGEWCAARRSRRAADAWIREQLDVKRLRWDEVQDGYAVVTLEGVRPLEGWESAR